MTDRLSPEDLQRYYRELFELDSRGVAILNDLLLQFAKPAVLKGGIDAVIETYHRMGSQAVVQHIVRQINRANGVNDNPSTVEIDP